MSKTAENLQSHNKTPVADISYVGSMGTVVVNRMLSGARKVDGDNEQNWVLNEADERLIYENIGERIAGETLLRDIDKLRDKPATPEEEGKINEALAEARDNLIVTLSAETQAKTGILAQDKAEIILADAKGAGLEAEISSDTLEAARSLLGSLTNEQTEAFLRSHVVAEEARIVQKEQKTGELKEVFIEQAKSAIAAGSLPGVDNAALLEKRVRSLNIRAVDSLFAGNPGAFQPITNTLVMVTSLHETPKYSMNEAGLSGLIDESHVFSHEGLHGSGAKVVLKNNEDKDVLVTRSGLVFIKFNTKELDAPRLRFLAFEEAVTQKANMIIQDKTTSPVRVDERELMDLVCESGRQQISEDLFFEAKFEDYDISKPATQRGLAWKRLWKSINEAHGRGFMVELDDMIYAYGVYDQQDSLDKALDFMKSLDTGGDKNSYAQLLDLRKKKADDLGLPSTASWMDIASDENFVLMAK